ncbi:T6SS phospholipase effector Tle1-like catalytic domain-containing protein [Tenacibaculum finnmarkense]|uniref:T6SS phospholipase effector Tle1-like catalytic domain-containing protein n=1 Tax=Tenacibaculum finnmarkense TaxID=2781243 RepID=UPI00187B1B4E|nr:DUF2235 domain-containing protein [Tenacibaculum finnmarkense]MBE7649194.1 hypothetical protein [Tenacibaculum finnmarkense genomovar ulcerans]MBE7693649.1 hypothetical protein [Tenacibaculum finnmarkense genomovar finnmarkense]MCD8401227.1 DUF2235 domain-containing protein [Tenacibaculum finnmarkense genomovar ulcerans]MCD8411016.1 DUF2235 domain-containing protein [Tenacibaculum finnmarkense genomovar ulcerans]MCG8237332.1 DUF2235 domain-containing protein [Tenacibaculum finnmarkense geno
MSGIIFGEYEETRTATERGNSIVIGVFFDGTGNNRKNARARKVATDPLFKLELDKGEDEDDIPTYKKAYEKHKHDSRDVNSYNADETNISRLEKYYIDDEKKIFKLYVEGIGTVNLEGDDTTGAGFGMGDTGITKRVEKACEDIVNNILPKVESDLKDENKFKLIDEVCFDVYGFSRGAVAARHFVSQIKKRAVYKMYFNQRTGATSTTDIPAYGYLGKALRDNKTAISTIKIRFAGLYDSVSSYGLDTTNDVVPLGLNQMNYVDKTVHITAQDELRDKFGLTGIESAGGKGLTINLPGSHSDIGGSYLEKIKEHKILLWDSWNFSSNKNKKIAKNIKYSLVEKGWYKLSEITIVKAYKNSGAGRNELWGTRKDVTNEYDIIPLQLMAELSTKYLAKINITKLKTKFDISNALLCEVHRRIMAEFKIKNVKNVRVIDLLKFDEKLNRKELKETADRLFMEEFKKHEAKNKKILKEKSFFKIEPDVTNIRLANKKEIKLPGQTALPSEEEDNTLTISRYPYYDHPSSPPEELSDTQLIRMLRNKQLHISYSRENEKDWYFKVLEIMKPREKRPYYDDMEKK